MKNSERKQLSHFAKELMRASASGKKAESVVSDWKTETDLVVAAAEELQRLGFADYYPEEGGVGEIVMTPAGRSYMLRNPRLRDPKDASALWREVAIGAIAAAVSSAVTLLISHFLAQP